MNTIGKYFVIGAMAIFIGAIVTLWILLKISNQDLSNFKTLYHDCSTAPVTTVTAVKPVVAHGAITVIPVPSSVHNSKLYVVPVSISHQSAGILTPVPSDSSSENTYAQTYNIGDSIKVVWWARTHGTIELFKVDSVTYPSRAVTVTKTVQSEPISIHEKSHLWLYAKPQAQVAPFKTSGITGGLIWTCRGKWGIGVGAGYLWNVNQPIVEGTLLLNLK